MLMMMHIKLLNGPLTVWLPVNRSSVGTDRQQLLHKGNESSGVGVVVGRHNK